MHNIYIYIYIIFICIQHIWDIIQRVEDSNFGTADQQLIETMILLKTWNHEKWPHWFPHNHPLAQDVWGLKKPAPSKEFNCWRKDVREEYLKKHPKEGVSSNWKLRNKKTVYLRKYKYELRTRQQLHQKKKKKRSSHNIKIITETDLEDDSDDLDLTITQLKQDIDKDIKTEESLWAQYTANESQDETNEKKLAVLGSVGLDWNKLFEKKLAKEYKLDAEDLHPRFRRETWFNLNQRKVYNTGWNIFKDSHFSGADGDVKDNIRDMVQTAKLQAYNKFIVNADPHCWESLICNPLGIFIINTSFKFDASKHKKKRKRKNKRLRKRGKRNHNKNEDSEPEEIYGKNHPTLNDFNLEINAGL